MEIGWISIAGSTYIRHFHDLNEIFQFHFICDFHFAANILSCKYIYCVVFILGQMDRLLIGQYVTMFGDVISHVNITAVKSEDGGSYECTAISKAGSASHSGRLNIYGKRLNN